MTQSVDNNYSIKLPGMLSTAIDKVQHARGKKIEPFACKI